MLEQKRKKKIPPTLTYLITCQGLLGCLLGSGLPSLGKRDNVLLLKHNLVRLPLNGILKLPMCGRPAQAVLYLGWMQLPLPWFLSSEVQPFPSAMNANSSSSWGKEASSKRFAEKSSCAFTFIQRNGTSGQQGQGVLLNSDLGSHSSPWRVGEFVRWKLFP